MVLVFKGLYKSFIKVSKTQNYVVWVHAKTVSPHSFFMFPQLFEVHAIEDYKVSLKRRVKTKRNMKNPLACVRH